MVLQWFVVRVPTNMEERVRESLQNRIKANSFGEKIPQVLVAQVSEAEIRRGIEERDRIDSTREDSPLVLGEGVTRIDTDALDADGVLEELLRRVRGEGPR